MPGWSVLSVIWKSAHQEGNQAQALSRINPWISPDEPVGFWNKSRNPQTLSRAGPVRGLASPAPFSPTRAYHAPFTILLRPTGRVLGRQQDGHGATLSGSSR